MSSRRQLSRVERYAMVILELKRGTGEPIIARDRAKGMTADQIVAEFEAITQNDHITPRALGGSDHVSNMQPLVEGEHAVKTKGDVKAIAKTRRIGPKEQEFRRRMLAKIGQGDGEEPQRWKKKGRPMPGSRDSPFRKKINGSVERRNGN
jgi:hypothetical protein